ncbi:hypothetical protein [Rhizobium leguminosarum]|uniref:hypothetical protein n=1 Tax=Rhizobium leguminosarum TaxID=384 RepID=UPI0026D47E92|nr:hypothetical protein [Rhizobium leguminosarum]
MIDDTTYAWRTGVFEGTRVSHAEDRATNLIEGNLRKPETLMEDNKLSNTAGSAKIQELATTGPSLV